VDLNNEFNQPGIFGFGTQDFYRFGSTNFATYQLFLAGILSDGSAAGNGYALQQGAGEFKQNRNTFAGLYVQDNYRITPRLTLNLGLRWEPALPWSDNGNRWAQVNLTAMAAGTRSRVYPNAPPGIFFSGQNGIASDPGMPKNALRAKLNGFAPRIGFAWDVFGDGKTSLRGGGGIFYDSRVMGMLSNRFVDEWPFSPQFILSTASVSTPGPGTSAGSFSDPLCQNATTQAALNCNGTQIGFYPSFPSKFPAPTNFAYSPPFNEIAVSYDPSGNYKVPTIYEWNLTLERQMPWNILARAAYVGSQSRHILETLFYNFSNPGFGSGFQQPFNPLCARTDGLANCTVFVGSNQTFKESTFSPTVQANVTDINGNYNALQLSMEKRASHGLTLLANYTWSRSLDDLPFGMGVSGFDGSYSPLPFNNPNRHRFDYGPSGFDRKHVFTASYVYQLPGFSGKGWLHNVLGGWEWSGLFSAASGRPITVLQGTNISNIGTGQDRGTLLPGANPYSSTACANVPVACKSWLNTGAFLTTNQVNAQFRPAAGGTGPGTVGNVSKNFLRLPNTWDMDMSASKYVNITERYRLQFRVEYFNIFNHPNFAPESNSSGNVNGTEQISAFDKINGNTSFGTFRVGQAADPRVAQFAVKLHF